MSEGAVHRLFRSALLASLLAAWPAAAQQPEPSHVERFTELQVKRQRAERVLTSHLAANPDDTQALIDRGVARLSLGKLEEAVADLDRAAELDAKSAEARAQLAYGLWLLGRLPEGLASARAALVLNPNLASAHYYAGRILLDTDGDAAEAQRHLQQATELDPEDAGIRLDLLTAYRRNGDLLRAAIQARLMRATLPPSDPRGPYAEGLLAVDLGQLSAAIDRFRHALQANPHFVPARYDLSRALVQSERWQEAAELTGSLAQDFPQSFTAAYLHALCLQNLLRGREAEQEARRAIALEPRSADAQTLLGIVLASRSAHADAVAALETAVRLDPGNFDAQFYLGRARYALRDLSQARDAFRAATALKPDDLEARFFLATTLEGLGDTDAALVEYRTLTERWPQDPRGWAGLGTLQARHGEIDAAAKSLGRARELDPRNFEAILGLGRVLARAGQLEPAITMLREAAALAPESAEAHYQLGLALQRVGRGEEAKAEFVLVDRLNQQYRGQGSMQSPPPKPPERN